MNSDNSPPQNHLLPADDHREGFFPGAGGTRIFWQAWNPPAGDQKPSPLPPVLIAHGMGEHSGRYRNLVNHILPPGYPVFTLDHRGHGRSEGKRGHIQNFNDYLEDLKTLQSRAAAETGRDRAVMIGHSLGGLIALGFALENQESLSRLIVSSPLLRLRVPTPAFKVLLGRVLSRTLPSLTMDNGLNPEHLSSDPGVVRAYIEDPLVHRRVSARWFTEVTRKMEWVLARAGRLTLPALFLHGGEDRITDPDATELFFSSAGSPAKKFIRYPGLCHEIFNEIGKEKVLGDLEEWLQSEKEPLP